MTHRDTHEDENGLYEKGEIHPFISLAFLQNRPQLAIYTFLPDTP